jgi:uncharacterized protein (AIM24 family)
MAPKPSDDVSSGEVKLEGFSFIDTTALIEDANVATIVGDDAQVLTLALGNGKNVQTQPGAMIHMSEGVKATTGFAPNCCVRCCCLGLNCCETTYTNEGGGDGYIGLTPNFPAKVIAEKLAPGKPWIVKTSGYMSSQGEINVDKDMDCCTKTCCCGSMGCCRTKIVGDGNMYLNAGGTIMKKVLGEGEEILIDRAGIVAFEESVSYDMQCIGNCLMICCGGEGMCAAKMTGAHHASLCKPCEVVIG